jgi:hypothetical protein
MIDKIKKLVGSIRFWIITFTAISAYLAIVERSGFSWGSLFDTLAVYLGAVAGVGTIDKLTANLKK